MSKGRSQEPTRKAESRTVQVRIGELVLDGFAPGDRFRITEGFKHELARLIREQGLGRLARLAPNTVVVDAGALQVGPGANAAAIGRRVAQSVHSELTGWHGKK